MCHGPRPLSGAMSPASTTTSAPLGSNPSMLPCRSDVAIIRIAKILYLCNHDNLTPQYPGRGAYARDEDCTLGFGIHPTTSQWPKRFPPTRAIFPSCVSLLKTRSTVRLVTWYFTAISDILILGRARISSTTVRSKPTFKPTSKPTSCAPLSVCGCGAMFARRRIASKGSATVFTVYAATRGLICVGVSTVTDASQRMPAAIPPTMARARESADLSRLFIA